MTQWGAMLGELRAVLGDEALARLVARFGGRLIRVPSPRSMERRERVRRVVAALDAGATYRATAAAEGVAVQTICADAKRST